MSIDRAKGAVTASPERASEHSVQRAPAFLRKAFLAAVALVTAVDSSEAGIFEKENPRKKYFNNGHVSIDSDVPGEGAFHIKLPNDEAQTFYFPLLQPKKREVMTEYHWATPEAAQIHYCNAGLNVTEIRDPHTYIPKPFSFTTRTIKEEQPKISFRQEGLLPPEPTQITEFITYQYVNGVRQPLILTNEEWSELEEKARRRTEERVKKWEADLCKNNIRIRGNAPIPKGYRIIAGQRVIDDVQRNAYIIDPESGSIWREK